ncbi:hypothetical protein [Bartonella queenslandensis]|uniref:hypothetical protein n=1 Tax=Bartonella queenslandensis TaxID=481138 RepID=UPI001BA74E9C|nr:hypothetical protein [Bartonella queenslandensis]
MMQEWIKIFLTGFLSFIGSLSVALILRNKDRKEAAKIRKDDLEKAAKKREEDREWISKQFAESQKQTTALEEQAISTKDLAEWSKQHVEILLCASRPPLDLKAGFDLLGQVNGISYIAMILQVTNLTKKDILIRNIQMSESSPFEFIENVCLFTQYRSDIVDDCVVIKRTAPKYISLDPKEIKSNSTVEFALNFFIMPATKRTFFHFLLSCSDFNVRNIANCTLEHTSPDNPDELVTARFWASYPRDKFTFKKYDPKILQSQS